MQCPQCKTGHLVRSERSGVEAQYCPQCRSWLDHEKLEELTKQRMREKGDTDSVTDTRNPVPDVGTDVKGVPDRKP